MRNEWRENIWLVLGLMIVSLAIWWISLTFYEANKGLFYKTGFNTDDVYKVDIKTLPKDSPDYVERNEEESEALRSHDLRMLIAGIRRSPYVEAAAFSQNGLPYNLGYYGMGLSLPGNDTIYYGGNFRWVSPDMVRVLKLTSRTGKSGEELERMLRNGDVFVSNVFSYWDEGKNLTPEQLLGNEVFVGDTIRKRRVSDIIDQMRRSDYDMNPGGMVLIPIDEEENFQAYAIGIRMKPGMGEKFREQFENDPTLQAYGNTYLSKLTSMKEEAKSSQKSKSSDARLKIAMIAALLVIIGLGMLGVFWFRIQQRIGEIAIRKVCGAKTADIFRRIISEGLILLTIATLLAAAIGWPLLKISLLKEENIDIKTALIVEIVAYVVVAIGISLSLWWPARRAMRIEPAIAIKDE